MENGFTDELLAPNILNLIFLHKTLPLVEASVEHTFHDENLALHFWEDRFVYKPVLRLVVISLEAISFPALEWLAITLPMEVTVNHVTVFY